MTEQPVKATDPQVDSPQRHDLNVALRDLQTVRSEIKATKDHRDSLITKALNDANARLKELASLEDELTDEVRHLGTEVFPKGVERGAFPGIYVIEKTDYEYDPDDALGYCKENFKAAVVTRLDEGMFLGLVKGIDPASLQKQMPWMKMIKYPFTMIASNLDEALPPPAEPSASITIITDIQGNVIEGQEKTDILRTIPGLNGKEEANGLSDDRETEPVGQ